MWDCFARRVEAQAGYGTLRRPDGRKNCLLLLDLQVGDFGLDLRLELIRGAAEFGEKTSSLTGDLRQLLRPKDNERQDE